MLFPFRSLFPSVAFAHLVWMSLLIQVARAASTYRSHACTNSTTGSNLTPNTTYYSNLNLLLSYLTSNATLPSGFYQTTVAAGTPNAATGLFICRGDAAADVCRECAASASKEVLLRCAREKSAIIWYDMCWIRYEDRTSFSTTPGIVPSTSLNSLQSVAAAEVNRFNDMLASAMNSVADKAANSLSGKKFATDDEKFTSSQTVYSMAQCTPDLSAEACNTCLQSAIGFFPLCCDGKQGGTVFLPSCVTRYELYPFYNSTGTAAIPPSQGRGKGSRSNVIMAIFVPIGVVLIFVFICFFLIRRKVKKSYVSIRQYSVRDDIGRGEILQFAMDEIETATNNFSDDNKIGEGGFGEVYMGTLPNGHKIAVKRLLRNSGQGEEQFKNEAVLVGKLQHRNLVRLLGFCLEREKKILIYEYVPNRSLDYFLFDDEKKTQLDWTRRYKIIGGIARGILYLHVDSQLRIIHRDLKASNILLDDDMNPKISDFGMAKVFILDQTHGSTNRIVGTYGYMSPEYAMHGKFSVKSDVFSFGVLVLEILSGKRNNFFYQSHGAGDLLSFAWEAWREGTPLELLDPTIRHSFARNEVIRCIHMGLLCVQEDPRLRPTMSTIVLMLNSYSVALPDPQQPAFFHRNRAPLSTSSKDNESGTQPMKQSNPSLSVDGSMITEVYPR